MHHHDFIKMLLNVKKMYFVSDTINPHTTIVGCFVDDLPDAIRYYLQKYSSLPEFALLDVNNDNRPIANVRSSYGYGSHKLIIYNINALRNLLFRDLCLFVQPTYSSYKDNVLKLRRAIHRTVTIGCSEFLIDSYSFSHVNFRYGDFYTQKLDRQFFDEHLEKMINIYKHLNDEPSKLMFLRALRARLDGSFAFFERSPYDEYFHPLVSPAKDDVLIDGGIWDKRVIAQFSSAIGNTGHIYAFEPLPSAYQTTRRQISEDSVLQNITLENIGLSDRKGEFYITEQGEGSQLVAHHDANTVRCIVTSIDSYVAEHKIKKLDMIKLDIEGAEPQALYGAISTLKEFTPKLAISIYHAPLSQIIDIPAMLLELNLGYHFYIGHHTLSIPYGTILYASKN